MKSNIKILTVLLVVILSVVIIPKQASGQQGYVSFQIFYDQLSPYGQWVSNPAYGYVWIPDAGPNFTPYSTEGYWVYTEYGWTWVSNYDWGWAPFHYGRWDFDDYYGWFWVPDNEWGPSWVNWRSADGYYGWSPMEPGMSISASFGQQYNYNNDHWMFVRDRDFERRDVNRYYVNRRVHNTIIVNSRVINTTYIDNSRHATYVAGPTRNDVQRNTGRNINTVSIRENKNPGQNMKNNQLQMYRPQIEKNNVKGNKPAPTRVSEKQDVKRPSEKTSTSKPRKASPNENKAQPIKTNIRNSVHTAQPAIQRAVNPTNNNNRQQQQQKTEIKKQQQQQEQKIQQQQPQQKQQQQKPQQSQQQPQQRQQLQKPQQQQPQQKQQLQQPEQKQQQQKPQQRQQLQKPQQRQQLQKPQQQQQKTTSAPANERKQQPNKENNSNSKKKEAPM
jgi:DNA segregation ATPase FtsK/SpoIIIE-like protein